MLSKFNLFDLFGGLELFETPGFSSPDELFKDVKYQKVEESGEDSNFSWRSESWKSDTGEIQYYKKVYTTKGFKEKTPDLKDLQKKLQSAIDTQRFEDAAKIRDQIKSIKL